MNAMLSATNRRPDAQALEAWWGQIREWQSIDCLRYEHSDSRIKPQYVLQKLYEITEGDAYITSDVGAAPDVGGAVLPLRQAAALDQLGGARDDGLRAPRGDGVCSSPTPDAKVACVTGEGSIVIVHSGAVDRKAVRTARKGRQTSTTDTSAWSGSGRSSCTRTGNRTPISTPWPDFAALSRSFGHVGMTIGESGRCRRRARGSLRVEGSPGVPGFHHRSHRKRLPDDDAGKGHHEMLLSEMCRDRELA